MSTMKFKNYFHIPVSCFAGYTACYIARNILSIIKPEMVAVGAASEQSISFALSLFFLSYGFGQLANGVLGDYIKARTIISTGLGITSIVLLLYPTVLGMPFGGVISGILWCLCGFALSMLWGPMTKLVAENLPEKAGVRCMTSLNVACIIGRMIAAAICTVAASLGHWKLAYYVAGGFTLLGALISLVLLSRAEAKGLIKSSAPKAEDNADRVPFAKLVPVLLSFGILPMIFISFSNGVIRNAVTAYIPTYISSVLGASTAMASVLSGICPFVELAGTFVGVWVMNKLHGDEIKAIGGMFGFSLVCYLMMTVCGTSIPALNLAWLFASCAAMSSACNLIYSKYCLRFSQTGRASLISGGLDFVSYIAASIATPLFDLTTAHLGETATVLSWALVSSAGLGCCLWATHTKKRPA